jgi:hypothetical protein
MAEHRPLTSRLPGAPLRRVAVAAAVLAAGAGLLAAVGGAASQAAAPQNTAPPSVSGAARQGSKLSSTTGSWTGDTPISFTFRWQRCNADATSCGDIQPAATGSSYTVAAADVGSPLRVVVTGANAAGSATAASAPTGVVTKSQAAPAVAGQPTPGGTASVGATLTAREGTWTGDAPISFTYQWQRCTPSYTCTAIPGATRVTYRVASADVGFRLRFVVSARNAFGERSIASNATAAVPSTAPAGAYGLPDGKTSIPVGSVALPQRLVISQVDFSPSPVRSRSPITARFRVTDTRGYAVRDALVLVIGIPYNWTGSSREVATGADGWAVIEIVPTARMPLKRGGAAVFFVRARKLGEPVLAGVTTRRLVQVRLARPF